jgi:hypothetical protein
MHPAQDGQPSKAPRRWGRWIGLSLLGLIALLILAHAFWGWWQEQKLGEEIAALRAKGEPMLPEDFKNTVVADAENAALVLRQAAQSIDATSEAWKAFEVMEWELPLTDAETKLLENVLSENQQAMKLVPQLRGKEFYWAIAVNSPMIAVEIPERDQLKRVGELVGAAILLAHQRGRDAEAIAHIEDLLLIARGFAQTPTLGSYFLAGSVTRLAAERVLQISPDLAIGQAGASPEQVRKLIGELIDETTLRDCQWRALQWERAQRLDAAREMILAGGKDSLFAYLARPVVLKDGRLMLWHMRELMGAVRATQDWPAFLGASGRAIEMQRQVRQSKLHLTAAILMGPDEGLIRLGYETHTDTRLAAVALAARWYSLEHGGALPGTLEELTPKHLPFVPKDPLAGGGKPLGYRPGEKRPIVYGVGKNGTDDGGSDKPLRKGIDYHHRWVEEDVVVDLKRQKRKSLEENGKE